jgi:hypothetical protein
MTARLDRTIDGSHRLQRRICRRGHHHLRFQACAVATDELTLHTQRTSPNASHYDLQPPRGSGRPDAVPRAVQGDFTSPIAVSATG